MKATICAGFPRSNCQQTNSCAGFPKSSCLETTSCTWLSESTCLQLGACLGCSRVLIVTYRQQAAHVFHKVVARQTTANHHSYTGGADLSREALETKHVDMCCNKVLQEKHRVFHGVTPHSGAVLFSHCGAVQHIPV